MPLVRVFNREGKLVGPVESAKLELDEAQWRARLTSEQYRILRSQGTERPFCGRLLDNKLTGVYQCAGCRLPLFSSDAKFQSGTGWPSFFAPIARENVIGRLDRSHGIERVEIQCARCDGHLGHVFEDGPEPTGLRFCLNSESLQFTPSNQLASLADPAAEQIVTWSAATPAERDQLSERATTVLAGGCFWCTEAAFEQLDGVLDVESGYAGGSPETAHYERVCAGNTGHAEAIRITFDPSRISYRQLLDVFFDAHDPTQLNRQGHDAGTQYRSAIFFASPAEKQQAEEAIRDLTNRRVFERPIVTTLEPLVEFFPAEAYHQDYARQHRDQPYIDSQAVPKVCKVRAKHPHLIRK